MTLLRNLRSLIEVDVVTILNLTTADDELREKELEKMGYHVIRFTNEDVLNNINNVIDQIESYFNG